MSRIETLTAYKCHFSYLERNNPLINELRDRIKSGDAPEYSLCEFLNDYVAESANLAIGNNADRAIRLKSAGTAEILPNGTKRIYIAPSAGKQGKPVTVYKPSTSKEYNYNKDSVALYEHHVFLYEQEEGFIAIFHRQNGSGCKGVFLETANLMIRHKGMKLEMELIMPTRNGFADATPTKFVLQYRRSPKSSDIADSLRKKSAKSIVREIGFNLNFIENSNISAVIHRLQQGIIDSKVAFLQIKNEVSASDEYNDASVSLKIGRNSKTVRWNDLERILGSYDITTKLNAAYSSTNNFVGSLSALSDEYYCNISSEVP